MNAPHEGDLLSFLHLIGCREHRRRGREAPMEGGSTNGGGAAWGGGGRGWRRREDLWVAAKGWERGGAWEGGGVA